ncbi:site-specific DNA-methyltransferase [Aliarcobacter cryaerophilus]|uniref:site-specific DNA-methyltransferase n=1 Tax=Aliarcobacter cryaerophilus TaxID=28198 RepID=UPI0011E034D1|nr:site-specific DNA-methyltransferase [Aliarcobacter cryaerophilus]
MSLEKNVIEEQSINEVNYELLKKQFPNAVSIDENGKYVIDPQKLQMSLDPSLAQIKEDGYGLNWVGKKEAYHNAFTKNYKVLKPLKDDSKNWDETENILIKGDNLDALKILRQNYFESIKMIYIDPPYNTKSDQFIYNDNFTSSTKKTLEDLGYDIDYIDYIENIQGAKTHSGWLNFMYPRLLLAKDLIKEDGVIFISIDDNEVAQLKIILDEIFGENNFIGNITRATGTTTGQDANKIGGSYDSLLCYIKSEKFKLFGIPLKGKDLNRFNNDDNDGKGKYALLQLRKTGNADRKEDRENMFYCIKAPDETDVYPIGPTDYLSRWRVKKETYDELKKEELIVWKDISEKVDEIDEEVDEDIDALNESSIIEESDVDIAKFKTNWKPYVKYYLNGRNKKVSNLWTDIDGNKKGSLELKNLFGKILFSNPKPTEFIKRLVHISNPNIVLDFFAGSGTTAQAIMELNGIENKDIKFILVQWAEKTPEKSVAKTEGYETIFDITKARIDKAGDQIVKGDIGFRTFEIVEDQKQKIYQKSLEDVSQEDLLAMMEKPDISSNEEILYNLFVAEALPLSTKHQELIKDKLYLASNVAFILGDITSDELVEALKDKKECEYITVYSPNISNDKFTLEIESNISKLGIKSDKLRFRG